MPAAAEQADLLAVVDLIFVRESDQTALNKCSGDEKSACDVWATYYLWEARVRRVLAGVETEKRFMVLFGRHSLVKRNRRRVTVAMKRLEPGSESGARYEVIATGSPQQLLCFDRLVSVEGAQDFSGDGGTYPSSCLRFDVE
jgi:hypothetical protein